LTRGKKRAAQKAGSRAIILVAADLAFGGNGFRATTIRDLASLSGMSTGAIFSQWSDKEAVFAACFPGDHQRRRVAEGICEALHGPNTWAAIDMRVRALFMAAADRALAEPLTLAVPA
jgi:AcrR family transcriptional regulator